MHVSQGGIFAPRDGLTLLCGVRSAWAGRPGCVGAGNWQSEGTSHDDWRSQPGGRLSAFPLEVRYATGAASGGERLR